MTITRWVWALVAVSLCLIVTALLIGKGTEATVLSFTAIAITLVAAVLNRKT
jgi:hypothetical protein